MEVSVISVENIKPYSGTNDLNPFKISLLDQLMPSVYAPFIYFYSHHNNSSASSNLKLSLSKALDLFYPLSGRASSTDRPSVFIRDFDQGVPFTEARFQGHRLSDFLQPPKLDLLNSLLPVDPACLAPVDGPQVAVQLNVFDCGGVALGLSFFHRIMDGGTIGAFLKTWAAFANQGEAGGDDNNRMVMNPPDLISASLVFPPRESVDPPQEMAEETVEITETTTTTRIRKSCLRRFVFDGDAISALKSAATSDEVKNPSRVEAVGSFIWKMSMQASPKLLHFLQSVNIRSRMGRRLSKDSVGNLTSTPAISCKDTTSPSLKALVAILRKGVERIDENYLITMSKDPNQWYAGASSDEEPLICSSWVGFGFNDFEFGLGKPVWTGFCGGLGEGGYAGSSFILKEIGCDGIEAWITMDEDAMAALESNPHFSEFASSNPPIVFNNNETKMA